MQCANRMDSRRSRGSCELDSAVHMVRLANLRWRLSACASDTPQDLPPSLRGLVTDTAKLSRTVQAPACLSRYRTRRNPPVRNQRSMSWSSIETDTVCRQTAGRLLGHRAGRPWARPQRVSFDRHPPIEVPTITSLGLQHRVPDRVRVKARRRCRKLARRRKQKNRVVRSDYCSAWSGPLLGSVLRKMRGARSIRALKQFAAWVSSPPSVI
mmetsp:Transcript_8270/g.22938  ORF Transcript_8270/g.22938 Transcript_8270/m.22938 type:complete len:211 (+) Transcript_8270:65-697(+)